MEIKNKSLFNFAVSYSGGGYKRLYEYAKWFNDNGGAWFIIHPNCKSLLNKFSNNQYFIAKQSHIQRLINDCGYLPGIEREIGQPDLYYSYGIPIYARFGKVDWIHLSNVIPLVANTLSLPLLRQLKFCLLGLRIRGSFEI